MAASSYSEVVRTVRLYASTAPLFLVRAWVNAAYKDLCSKRRWSFLRAETTLAVGDARALTAVTATQASATLTAAAEFLAADVGRQIRIGTYPYYTITAVTDASTVTLDRPYGGLSVGPVAAQILDAYVTLPSDFGSFRTIADMYNRRPVPFWGHEDELLAMDPRREYSGIPRAFVVAAPSPVPATLGQVRYEIWPASTAARAYPALYNKQEDALTDRDSFTGVLRDGGEVLVEGALWKAAEWPGTPDQKNPYFNLAVAAAKKATFDFQAQQLSLRDDDHAPDDLSTVDWSRYDTLARTATALRSSDATLTDYF